MWRKFFLSLLFGVLVLTALTLFGDLSHVLTALSHFPIAYLPAILGLTLWNYSLRFVKWHIYIRCLEIPLRFSDSLAIFLCGLSMAVTPGKAGELLKSVFLRQKTGTPVARSAPIILAERLTDGLAMVCLAATGLLLYKQALIPIALVLLVFILIIVTSQLKVVRERVMPRLLRHPRLARRAEHITHLYTSTRILLSPPLLLGAVVIGLLSWSGECLALYLILLGLGFPASGILVIQAACILAVSTLIGSATLLPGGLGSAESSSTALLVAIAHATVTQAAAATLLIRLCTLWFGVCVGMLALFFSRHRFSLSRMNTSLTSPLQPSTSSFEKGTS